MCRCRDTGSKRCKWEHPSDTYRDFGREQNKKDRYESRRLLRLV